MDHRAKRLQPALPAREHSRMLRMRGGEAIEHGMVVEFIPAAVEHRLGQRQSAFGIGGRDRIEGLAMAAHGADHHGIETMPGVRQPLAQAQALLLAAL
jgi:hypothetical protein